MENEFLRADTRDGDAVFCQRHGSIQVCCNSLVLILQALLIGSNLPAIHGRPKLLASLPPEEIFWAMTVPEVQPRSKFCPLVLRSHHLGTNPSLSCWH